jgi:hypothetical protein
MLSKKEKLILQEAAKIQQKLNEARLDPELFISMSDEEKLYAVEGFLNSLGPKIRERIEYLKADAREQLDEAYEIDKAWKAWDFQALYTFGVFSKQELELIKEVLGDYGFGK